jgi:hypothetical protein
VTLSGLPTSSRIPAASGLSNFMRIMAGGIGASVSTTLWENRAILHHAQLSENMLILTQSASYCRLAAGHEPYAQITRLIGSTKLHAGSE